jgi:Ca-activated chloride channel family protein
MPETTATFHFAAPHWLWALLVLVPVAIWLYYTLRKSENTRIKDYADAHLLPHLVGARELVTRGKWRHFAYWALLWIPLVIAMAGPRWNYTEIQMFSPRNSLVVVLDISRSMQVADVRPSRFSRARQELEDLLNQGQGLRFGLIAFASVAHVIAPVTEDLKSIRRILPALSTDLVRLQGSRLSYALDRAGQLLEGQPLESSHSLLLISDGGFVEEGLIDQIEALTEKGIRLHVLGIGTEKGGWVPEPDKPMRGQVFWKPVLSRLNEGQLRSLAKAGSGIYQSADYLDDDTQEILDAVMQNGSVQTVGENQTRVWEEHFYWLVGLVLLLLISQYRRLSLLSIVRKGTVS